MFLAKFIPKRYEKQYFNYFNEFKTSEIIVNELEKLGIKVQKNIAKTGVVGLIEGKYPGKTVLLRADMDALKIQEQADVDYKSKVDGMMHACGHDAHAAMLLGAANILNHLKDDFEGTIKLIFQPGEEIVTSADDLKSGDQVRFIDNKLVWSGEEQQKMLVEVYDSRGVCCMVDEIGGGKTEVSLQMLPTGIYFVTINGGMLMKIRK